MATESYERDQGYRYDAQTGNLSTLIFLFAFLFVLNLKGNVCRVIIVHLGIHEKVWFIYILESI